MAPALSLPGRFAASPGSAREGSAPGLGEFLVGQKQFRSSQKACPRLSVLAHMARGRGRGSVGLPWGPGLQSHQGGPQVQVVPVGQRDGCSRCLTASTLGRKVGTGTKSLFSTVSIQTIPERLDCGALRTRPFQTQQAAHSWHQHYMQVVPQDGDSPRSLPFPPQLPAQPPELTGGPAKPGPCNRNKGNQIHGSHQQVLPAPRESLYIFVGATHRQARGPWEPRLTLQSNESGSEAGQGWGPYLTLL